MPDSTTSNIRIHRMELSDLDYVQLVERLEGRTVCMTSGSRRQSDREELPNGTVVILEMGGDDDEQQPLRYQVRARNISSQGMSFFHTLKLSSKQACTLLIITPDRSGWRVQAKVVRSRDVGDAIYEIGVAFDQSVNLDPLRTVSDAAEAESDEQAA